MQFGPNNYGQVVHTLTAVRVSGEGIAIGRVRLFSLDVLNQLTFDLDFSIYNGRDQLTVARRGTGNKSRGQRLRIRVRRIVTRSV